MMLWWECVLKTLPESEWGRSVIFLTLKIKHVKHDKHSFNEEAAEKRLLAYTYALGAYTL